jgi:Sulfatase
MAVGWAWAFDTPFKWVKQIASHFGGTRQGLAISWPGHIKDVGGIRTQFHHVIDIVPTILELTGIRAPEVVNGIKQKPIEGVSMAYTFDPANANAPSKRDTQYFELGGNRAIYHDDWIAATTPPAPPWVMGTAKMPDVVNGCQWEALQYRRGLFGVQRPRGEAAGKIEGIDLRCRCGYPHAGGRQLQRAVPVHRDNQQVDLQTRAGVERGGSKGRNGSIRQSQ